MREKIYVKVQRANGGGWDVVIAKYHKMYRLEVGDILTKRTKDAAYVLFHTPQMVKDGRSWPTRKAARRAIRQYMSYTRNKVVGGLH